MSELSFVKSYNQSLDLFPDRLDPQDEGNHAAPVVLPKMDVSVPPVLEDPQQVTVTLRSIRAPKFSVEYEVSDSESVFAIKERLLSDPNGPLVGAAYPVSAVRLLIKAKAVADVRQLRELVSLDFTVMLMGTPDPDARKVNGLAYWETKGPEQPKETEPAVHEPAKDTGAAPESTDAAFWTDVAAVLAKHGKQHLLSKFQAAAN